MPTIHHGDCIETMNAMPPESVDAIVTDPPYGLGFMGKKWDGLPPSLEWAEACYRVLKPGGHIAAFGGTRTWHRLAVAIEDAGFEMRDSLAWLYGSGFPKSQDVSKSIDKRGGKNNEVDRIAGAIKEARMSRGWTVSQADAKFCGGTTQFSWFEGRPRGTQIPSPEVFARMVAEWPELEPWAGLVTEAERARTGTHRTGLATGPSGVGGSAGPGADRRDIPATPEAARWQGWGTALKPAFEPIVLARKPFKGTVAGNVLAHGTGAINVDACRIAGEPWKAHRATGLGKVKFFTEGETPVIDKEPHTAGRWPANVLLDHHAAAWVDEQSGHQKDGVAVHRNGGGRQIGSGLIYSGSKNPGPAPDIGYGGSGGASRFFYTAKAPKRERPNVDGVQHPTVKPLAIMRWLIRLVTPPGGVVLDPFAGSGTTIEAALIEGFDPVGIEMETDYLPLIQHRIDRQAGTLTA